MYSRLFLICIGLTLVVASASALRHSEWLAYKQRFGKTYTSQEDDIRKAILAESKRQVHEHNAKHADKLGYTMAINHMSDWTPTEKASLNGLRMPEKPFVNTPEAEQFLAKYLDDDTPLPKSVDWRKTPGRVTSVKNQGMCGSCWAFSTTGVLEGQEILHPNYTHSKDLVPLSEQNLVDCSARNEACSGGFPVNALRDVQEKGGIESEKVYPYEGWQGNCRFDKTRVAMTVKGGATLPSGDVVALKKMVARFGPISVGMDAQDSLFNYHSGIFDSPVCDPDALDHAVLVVGYDTDPKVGDYWIIKNSWGPTWGEKGYFRIKIQGNLCGIATQAAVPVF